MSNGLKQYAGGGGSSVPDTFDSDFVVSLNGGKTFGKYVNGQTVPAAGKKASEVILLAAIEFLVPVFTSFQINGQSSPVEVGTVVSGSRTFSWSTTNPGNVAASLSITDLTNAIVLATGLANDGIEVVNVGSVVKLTPNSNTWRIAGFDTNGGAMAPRDYTVVWQNRYFAGPRASVPVTSADVRGLPQNSLYSGVTVFNLNTGNTLTDFYFAVRNGSTITQVIDLDALNAVITSQYVDQGTITVQDVGGNNMTYRLYRMTNAIPYTTNHRHQITFV